MYTAEEFDNLKTKILKYILYKKRTEQEIKQKFNTVDSNILESAIEYLKQAGYINDNDYIKRAINEFMNLNNLSIKEIRFKLASKGLQQDLVDDYIYANKDELLEYEITSAKKIFNKKIKNTDLEILKNYLYKKGYMEETIHIVLEGVKNGSEYCT